jgi:hypothetical protein
MNNWWVICETTIATMFTQGHLFCAIMIENPSNRIPFETEGAETQCILFNDVVKLWELFACLREL